MVQPFSFNKSSITSVALLTKHAKGPLIAEALSSLGLSVFEETGFDTDSLGTFAGEVERTLSPIECARKKAQLACELAGTEYGMGSEGSFGGGPLPGIVNWNTELLVLFHAPSNRAVVAQHQTSVAVRAINKIDLDTLEHELASFDQKQGWIVKSPKSLHKGILGPAAVKQRILDLLESGCEADNIHVEPDLRALYCPERQNSIIKAAEQLAARLSARCPKCDWPDFYGGKPEPGLRCEQCDAPTHVPQHYTLCCAECGYVAKQPNPLERATAANCQWCNP